MSWVDLVVLVLAVLAGISGWRHGVAVALLSFVGVIGGAILGVRLAPLLVQGIESNTTRIIASVTVVVLLIALGETTGVLLGRRVGGDADHQPHRPELDGGVEHRLDRSVVAPSGGGPES